MGPIRYGPLRAKASPRRVAAWRESVLLQEAREHPETSAAPVLRASRWVVVAALLTVLFGALTGLIVLLLLSHRMTEAGPLVVAVLATSGSAVLWALMQKQVRQQAEGWRDPFRLMTFAHANGFHAVPVANPADLPGRIFHRGLEEHRVRLDVVAWVQGGRQCHVGTECWSSGDDTGPRGTPQDEGSCRYLAVRIGKEALPRAEFDAFGADESAVATTQEVDSRSAGSSLSLAPSARDPRIRVEPGAEQWVEALFSERVTRLLTNVHQPRQAEVVGEWFITYDLNDAEPLSISGWERTFHLVAALPAFPVQPPSSAPGHDEIPTEGAVTSSSRGRLGVLLRRRREH
ncbi:hypothetical protein FNH13_08435 [Ornithinimicrobium ciconiae]|uniref:Uncharacterized protein n=1 Tax=Ornithinimicrobium ciconiae TaxID=2594265 RepID=A0A516GA24_9MICO|nr:hypothetical protein [Ornithinimicrobium ciconiae]QDO88368.1 hypothetical protein FNH13_08435 [Ornithinimicrobium ciconiae]